MSELTDWLKKEIKKNNDYIVNHRNCPYCENKLTIGSTGFAETKIGCYDNKECSYRIKHKYYGYTVDIGKEEYLVNKYNGELAIVQMMESLRKMRDEHPVHYDSLVDADFLMAYDLMKELYNKIERTFWVLTGNSEWDDVKGEYVRKVKK